MFNVLNAFQTIDYELSWATILGCIIIVAIVFAGIGCACKFLSPASGIFIYLTVFSVFIYLVNAKVVDIDKMTAEEGFVAGIVYGLQGLAMPCLYLNNAIKDIVGKIAKIPNTKALASWILPLVYSLITAAVITFASLRNNGVRRRDHVGSKNKNKFEGGKLGSRSSSRSRSSRDRKKYRY